MSGHNMRNPALLGALTNWKPVADALPGRCGVMDLDGIIERRGRFLVMESKQPGEEVSKGQEILLQQLSRLSEFTVLVVWMERVTGEVLGFHEVRCGQIHDFIEVDSITFGQRIRRWFDHATNSTDH